MTIEGLPTKDFASCMSDEARQFVIASPVARLATADADARPQVIPVCFTLSDDTLYITIDGKPKQASARPLKRIRNILANPAVCLVVDRYSADWAELGWVMLHGRARILDGGEEHRSAQAQLRDRYPQYRSMQLEELPVIAIDIKRGVQWGNLALAP
jgi:PPOX class probable F420-dependent enzyme